MASLAHIMPYIQIGLSILIIVLVLLQQSDADLGGTFGGSDNLSASRTRRGSEKYIFNATIVVGILFATTAIIALIAR